MTKRIILSIVVVLLVVYTIMAVKCENEVRKYQRATIAYVQGAERNGAISASESRYMQHLAGASSMVHGLPAGVGVTLFVRLSTVPMRNSARSGVTAAFRLYRSKPVGYPLRRGVGITIPARGGSTPLWVLSESISLQVCVEV